MLVVVAEAIDIVVHIVSTETIDVGFIILTIWAVMILRTKYCYT